MSNSLKLSESVELRYQGNVALLIVNNPPVNVLSYHVRAGLYEGIEVAQSGGAEAIVLLCRGRTFIAGADIRETNQEMIEKGPIVWSVQSAMEDCKIPIIAAIHGAALGGGLEVALCAHYRVAVPSAQFGLPEVKLGRVPGGGGPQRLLRIVGLEKTLAMVVDGEPIDAKNALSSGLIDEVVENLEDGAIEFAQQVVAQGGELVRIRDRGEELNGREPQIIDKVRQQIAERTRGFLAPEQNIKAIEAALKMDFDSGLIQGRKLADELRGGAQQVAQQYYFFAERAASKVPRIDSQRPRVEIQSCGLLCAGESVAAIAARFIDTGIPVTIVARNQRELEHCFSAIRNHYQQGAAYEHLSIPALESRLDLLAGSLDYNDLADVDIVIDSMPRNKAATKQMLLKMDATCRANTILACNNFTLSMDEMAAASQRPERVIGMDFLAVENEVNLLEVVRGTATSEMVIATVLALGKRLGMVPVVRQPCQGSVADRMYSACMREAEQLVLEGARLMQVEYVIYQFGFQVGPFSRQQRVGPKRYQHPKVASRALPTELLAVCGNSVKGNGNDDFLCENGSTVKHHDSEADHLVRQYALSQGVKQREISDQEALERCLYSIVNEGVKILEESMLVRGSDIDVIAVNGFGWPVYLGGPLFWADSLGLSNIIEGLEKYQSQLGGGHWEPTPLLRELAANGGLLHQYVA